MRRLPIVFLAATWALAVATARAQGDLSGVTMRVLDDVSDIDAVILALDAGRAEDEEGAEAGSGAGEARSGDRNAAEAGEPEQERSDGRREDLHDPAVDERSEGKLEDNDVESPAVPPAP